MNTSVSFELAKMLKEEGFDDSTETLYWLEDELDPEVVYSRTPRQGFFKEYGGSLLAPTIAEVVMWLYKNYGIWTTVTSISQESWQCHMTKKGDSLGKCYLEDFYTPTEAYEAAVKYTLENLIP